MTFISFTVFNCFQSDEMRISTIPDSELFLTAIKTESDKNEGYLLLEDSFLALSTTNTRENQVLGANRNNSEREEIVSHKVKPSESLDSIAKDYNVSVNTIKWANSLKSNNLSSGDELLILPTTGVLYYVERGDTLSDIAQRHNADGDEIIEFNDVEDETDIKPGDQLIIPNGEKPANIIPQTSPSNSHTGFGSVTYGTVTQGMHAGHNAVDIANNCGTPIYSGSSGVVMRTGNDPSMAGNYIWVDHGSFKALYAHLWQINVSGGQRVSAGQQIGTMGNTGYTIGATGCHIHFEVREGSNPFRGMRPGQTMQ